MLNRIVAVLTNPYRLFYMLRGQAGNGGLYRRYRRLAEKAGFAELYFII